MSKALLIGRMRNQLLGLLLSSPTGSPYQTCCSSVERNRSKQTTSSGDSEDSHFDASQSRSPVRLHANSLYVKVRLLSSSFVINRFYQWKKDLARKRD